MTDRKGSDAEAAATPGVWKLELLPILQPCLVRAHPGLSERLADGYGAGRGAAVPGRRCTTIAAEALKLIKSFALAPPQAPIGNGVTGWHESVWRAVWMNRLLKNRLFINCVRHVTISHGSGTSVEEILQ